MDTKEKTRRAQSGKADKVAQESATKRRPAAPEQPSAGKRPSAEKRSSALEKRRDSKAPERPRKRTTDRGRKKRSIAEDVVYLPPKPFSRNRLLLRLVSVAAVVLAVMVGISIFFNVKTVVVSGCNKYTEDMILAASGIQVETEDQRGDSLLTFSRAKAAGKIIGELNFIESVRFGIKLPGTVYIEVTEIEVTYAMSDAVGNWWLISSSGKVVQQLSSGEHNGYTNVLGVKLDMPTLGAQAVALEEAQPSTDENGNTIALTVTAQKRLNTALNILQYLEQNSIIGEAAFVDVTDLSDISLQYGNRYRILLGDDTNLSQKVNLIPPALRSLSLDYPYATGTLDISDLNKIRFDQDEA